MKPKNTICLWFDKDAHEAARFYAATFPDSKVTATGTRSSAMAARKASAVGARIAGASPGRSPRVR
jgi:predicted 3-demethylubiquinone-9 3-methyltransferase (glyoxalase superfamily)